MFFGKPFKTGLSLNKTNFPELLKELRGKRFTGSVCLTIKTSAGFEDGFLLFDSGKVVGCGYERMAQNKVFEGRDAFERFVNAAASKKGVLDLIELTSEELHSTLALNEKLLYTTEEVVMPKEFKEGDEQDEGSGEKGFFKKFKVKAF